MTESDYAPLLPHLREAAGSVDVLVIGPYFCDIVYTGVDHLPELGEEVWANSCAVVPGGTFITAAALHRLGVQSAWSTTFGSDPFSRFAQSCATDLGMNPAAFTISQQATPNLSTSISVGVERSFVSFATDEVAQGAAAGAAQIRALRPRLVVLPGLALGLQRRILDAVEDVGALLYVDPQSEAVHVEPEQLNQVLVSADVFAPNEREATVIGGGGDPLKAAADMAMPNSLIVVKRGPLGVVALDRSGRMAVPGIPVVPVDTTGAGDCFNAGFIMAWLRGESIRRCLELGNAAGALSSLAPSSLGVPTLAAVERAARHYDVGAG